MTNLIRKSNAMKYAKGSVNLEQFIDRCSVDNTNMKMKSGASINVYNRIVATKRPVCTTMGIFNPAKLNISKLNIKGLAKVIKK